VSGLGLAWPKKLKKKIFWAEIGPTILGRCWPTYSGLSSAQPTCFNNIYLIYIYIYIYIYIFFFFTKTKRIQKNFKNHFKKILIFLNIFLPILHNIGLYIYTVKYKSGIKIPDFSEIFQKKKFKTFSKKYQKLLNQFPFLKKKQKKYFVFIRPNPKNFPNIFSLKDCIFFMF